MFLLYTPALAKPLREFFYGHPWYNGFVFSGYIMDVQFINTKEWGIEPKRFQIFIKRLKKHVPDPETSSGDGVLNVVFVNDTYIRSLNKTYRKKDEPTDVLSFSYLEAPDFQKTQLIGEIYISVPTAKRQAKENKWTLLDELSKLFVHGFLHVFGHNHESKSDYKKMSKIESEVLQQK